MNATNTNNFMKDSSTYITNINRVLKNIKLEVMADFIHMEKSGLVITTNKVASNLNLQNIEKYMNNLYSIDTNNVESPDCLNPNYSSRSLVFSISLRILIPVSHQTRLKVLSRLIISSIMLFWPLNPE